MTRRREPADLEWVALDQVTPWERNPRINEHTVADLAEAIQAYGFATALTVNRRNGKLVGGHARYAAARRLELERVPVRWVDLDEKGHAELAILLNKSEEKAEWNPAEVAALASEFSIDLGALGWSDSEVAELVKGVEWSDAGDERPAGYSMPETPSARVTTLQLYVETTEIAAIEEAIERALVRAADRGKALELICREWSELQG